MLSVQQPDLTQTIKNNTNPLPNNNHTGSMEKMPMYLDNAINTNKSLLLDETARMSSERLPQRRSKISMKSSECDSRPQSAYSVNRHSILGQLPSNMDPECLVWATVSHTGGRITLPDSGVSMTIPEGAIEMGETEDIFLAVSRDDKDRPKLTDGQTVLSPVIMVGPQGLTLLKPIILTFQHCASIKHGQWSLSVYNSLTRFDEPPQWQLMSELGSETINTPIYVQMEMGHCHIMTDMLLRYTLLGKPSMAGKPMKQLRVAVFAPSLPSTIDYDLRVYFVEDTRDALEGVMQVERKLGGCLLDLPRQVLFQYSGDNLCLAIEELEGGWRCKQAANYQEIPFQHVWSGTQNGLHCSFALEHTDRGQHHLGCHIHVFQKAMLANRQVLQISCNLDETLAAAGSPSQAGKAATHRNSTVTNLGCNSMVTLEPPQKVFRLPPAIKRKLCQILDTPNARGNDWRMLAQRLSVDRYINYFATKTSPTEHILDLWEARHREESAVTDLMNSLRVMGRMDAAGLMEKEMGPWL
ncbi:hypothetical protein NP493_1301g00030 [Ridgeia piscesae]|uniref:Netrin receptor UNC5 n=1 Tax=Ridgeia piscesae TaxID=27915 RepID=A0AAD9K8J9_RIDPI|nr:hypothetical protein NP493_1301g00030 [Ridgeia piscesae]